MAPIDQSKTYTVKGTVLVAMLTAAAAGGYAAGEAEFVPEAVAQTEDRMRTVEAPLSASSVSSLASIVSTDVCPVVDAKFGLTAGTCTPAKIVDKTDTVCFARGNHPETGAVEYRAIVQVPLRESVSVSME